jgi:hypothetical protein
MPFFMSEDRFFLGRGWSFPPTFLKALGAVEMVQNEEDIRQSIIIFLSTRAGERLMRLNYGTTLYDHIFSSTRQGQLNALADELKLSLRLNEPRILVHKLSVHASDVVEGKVQIDIEYEIEATNVRNNIVFPFYLVEGTNIIK